jgi:hypothetical protein
MQAKSKDLPKEMYDSLVGDLRTDMTRLERTVMNLKDRDLLGDPPAKSNDPFQGYEPTFELDDAAKAKLLPVINKPQELRTELDSVVQAKIIDPRFAELKARWGTERESYSGSAKGILADVAAGREAFPEGDSLWDEVERHTQAALVSVTSLRIEPPAGKDWIWSVHGKVRAQSQGQTALSRELLKAAGYEDVVARLQDQITRTHTAQLEVDARIAAELQKAEQSTEKFKERAGTLSKPFEWLALDADFLLTHFPLLLGAGYAAGLWCVTNRRRRVVQAYDTFGGDEPALTRWCQALGHTYLNRKQLSWSLALWGGGALLSLTFVTVFVAIRGTHALTANLIGAVMGLTIVLVALWHHRNSLRLPLGYIDLASSQGMKQDQPKPSQGSSIWTSTVAPSRID